MLYIPHGNLRDFRVTGVTNNYRAIGRGATLEIEQQEIHHEKMASSYKLKLAKSGVHVFGTVSYLLFKKKVAEKMGNEIPELLASFNVKGSEDLATTSFRVILSCIFNYAQAAFIAYEAKIAEQKKIIHMLSSENAKINKRGRVSNPCSVESGDGYGLRSLRRHASHVVDVVRMESGGCDMKAIVLAREVLRRIERHADKHLDSGLEAMVNKAIVQQLELFYQEVKRRHRGRFPEMDRAAWSSMNSVLSGVKGICSTKVADAVGMDVNQLYKAKQRWKEWLQFDGVGEEVYLQALSEAVHGNSWPEEWVQFISDMWLDPRITRRGEGAADYCYDPKQRKDRPKEPHPVHYLEKPLYTVQNIMQVEGELRFPPTFAYSDGKARKFPIR